MKINEIIMEFDQSSDYSQNVQNELVNFLSSLNATGLKDPVKTNKIIKFMKSMGYDIQPEQIDDILAGTEFGGDDEEINLDQGNTPAQNKKEVNNNKVSQMADKQIKRGM